MGILIWVTNRCVYTNHVLMYTHEDTCFLVTGSRGGEGGEGIMRIFIWVTKYYSHELMFITLRYTSHVLMYIHEDVHIESCRVCRHLYESRTNVYTWVTNKCIYMSHEQMYTQESRTKAHKWRYLFLGAGFWGRRRRIYELLQLFPPRPAQAPVFEGDTRIIQWLWHRHVTHMSHELMYTSHELMVHKCQCSGFVSASSSDFGIDV